MFEGGEFSLTYWEPTESNAACFELTYSGPPTHTPLVLKTVPDEPIPRVYRPFENRAGGGTVASASLHEAVNFSPEVRILQRDYAALADSLPAEVKLKVDDALARLLALANSSSDTEETGRRNDR